MLLTRSIRATKDRNVKKMIPFGRLIALFGPEITGCCSLFRFEKREEEKSENRKKHLRQSSSSSMKVPDIRATTTTWPKAAPRVKQHCWRRWFSVLLFSSRALGVIFPNSGDAFFPLGKTPKEKIHAGRQKNYERFSTLRKKCPVRCWWFLWAPSAGFLARNDEVKKKMTNRPVKQIHGTAPGTPTTTARKKRKGFFLSYYYSCSCSSSCEVLS